MSNTTLPAAVAALPVPSREESLAEALRHLAHRLGASEQIWLAEQSYDDAQTTWRLSIVRQGAQGRWALQRYRYDGQAETLYYIGERPLSSADLAAQRRGAEPFDVAAWQRRG